MMKFNRTLVDVYCQIIIAVLLSSCIATPKGVEETKIPSAVPTLISTSIVATSVIPQVTATELPSTPDITAPDVIFYNGEILTLEDGQPTGQAIAILDNKIVAVGSNAEILVLQSPQTRLIDIGGLTIMPGFVDAHSHLFSAAGNWGLDLEGAQQVALEGGITSLGEMSGSPEFISEMKSFSESGFLRVRTTLYMGYNTNCGEVLGDWYRDYPPTRSPGEILRIGGVKIFTDGGSCGAPAVSFQHPVYGYGDLWLTQDELNSVLVELQARGYQAAIHAIGDRGVDQALNAVEFALNGKPNSFRHRIEHNSLVRDDQVFRYGAIGIVPLIFGSYPICSAEVSPPSDQQGWEWRWRDLIDNNPNLHFAWHSDMLPRLFAKISPLQHLFSMVTPSEVASDGVTVCDTPSWVAENILSVEEALPMMTVEGAYALFLEEEVGSIRPGKYADLIILSGNPTKVDANDIIDIKVLMTMIGGHVEYCAAGYEAQCPMPAVP